MLLKILQSFIASQVVDLSTKELSKRRKDDEEDKSRKDHTSKLSNDYRGDKYGNKDDKEDKTDKKNDDKGNEKTYFRKRKASDKHNGL